MEILKVRTFLRHSVYTTCHRNNNNVSDLNLQKTVSQLMPSHWKNSMHISNRLSCGTIADADGGTCEMNMQYKQIK